MVVAVESLEVPNLAENLSKRLNSCKKSWHGDINFSKSRSSSSEPTTNMTTEALDESSSTEYPNPLFNDCNSPIDEPLCNNCAHDSDHNSDGDQQKHKTSIDEQPVNTTSSQRKRRSQNTERKYSPTFTTIASIGRTSISKPIINHIILDDGASEIVHSALIVQHCSAANSAKAVITTDASMFYPDMNSECYFTTNEAEVFTTVPSYSSARLDSSYVTTDSNTDSNKLYPNVSRSQSVNKMSRSSRSSLDRNFPNWWVPTKLDRSKTLSEKTATKAEFVAKKNVSGRYLSLRTINAKELSPVITCNWCKQGLEDKASRQRLVTRVTSLTLLC